MYLDYFGLSRLPFSIAPDPDLLYLSPAHHDALAHLNYALTGHGGLICLTGEVGMGKTTLCRAFIDQAPNYVDIAYIFNPVLSATELLQAICQELEIPCVDANNQLLHSNKQLFDALYHGLIERYSQGKKVICIIDEAQSMPAPLLEQVRLLTNLETNKDKLLTLILVGQPELQEILSQHGIRQLDQRITARFHLKNMDKKQLPPYLQHRLKQAGCEQNVFDRAAVDFIWQAAKGIPRLINSIADRALLGAYATSSKTVSKKIAEQAASEVLGENHARSLSKRANQESLSFFNNIKPIIKYLTKLMILVLVIGALLTLGALFSEEKLKEVSLKGTSLKDASLKDIASDSWSSLFSTAAVSNHYQQLAEANGLDSELIEFNNCSVIAANSSWQCLSLDWPLADLKRLQRPIAVFDGASWQVTSAQQLMLPPLRNVLLWQPMSEYGEGLNRPIKPGVSHPLVVWVRGCIETLEQLNQNELNAEADGFGDWQIIAPTGQESLGFNDYYDPLLARKIGKFQAESGLKADRIIGLKTLLALQKATSETD